MNPGITRVANKWQGYLPGNYIFCWSQVWDLSRSVNLKPPPLSVVIQVRTQDQHIYALIPHSSAEVVPPSLNLINDTNGQPRLFHKRSNHVYLKTL